VRDLRDFFAPDVLAAIDRLVDERLAAALVAHGNGANDTPWYTLEEAADYMRISERTLERLVSDGRIRTHTIGRRRIAHRDVLDAYLRATTGEDVTPATPPRRRRLRSLDASRGEA
jgi:excisionase family DNA binding protein